MECARFGEKISPKASQNQAMKLIGRVDSSEGHYAQEKTDLVDSLVRKGLLAEGSSVDDVLQITVEHMLARRLQSVVYYRGLAPSMRAARNMIVHGHISIGDQRMTVPGYKILRQEEDMLQYSATSPYLDENHPFRVEMEQLRMTRQTEEGTWKKSVELELPLTMMISSNKSRLMLKKHLQ